MFKLYPDPHITFGRNTFISTEQGRVGLDKELWTFRGSLSTQPAGQTTSVRREERGWIRTMLIHLGFKAAQDLCLVGGKRK